jgi:F-type H+-transporting ATPase subunit b
MFSIDATFLVIFFSFLVFMLVMNNVFFTPMLNIKNEREDTIEAGKTAADEAARKTASLTAEYQSHLAEARRKAQQIIQEKREWAKGNAQTHVTKAREEANSHIEAQSSQLKASRDKVYESLQEQREDFSRTIVEKLSSSHQKSTAGASS